MAETNVQGQVVQATVVGQPVGQAVGCPQPGFQQQAVYGQQPMQVPYGYVQQPYGAYNVQTPDQSGAQMGWMLYGIGWVLCCCFGPVGPVFWFAVACMHYCKPKEARENMPLEGQVACVSLGTAIATTIVTVIIIALLIVFWAQIVASADDSYYSGYGGSYSYSSSYNRWR
eukprot:Skav229173  [mRNA]  locus=scaffold1004:40125:45717:+ [translate_table: standard]